MRGWGLASSFALNRSAVDVEAVISEDVTATIGAGDLSVRADAVMDSRAVATAAQARPSAEEPTTDEGREVDTNQTGDAVGIGASVAILASDLVVLAHVADGVAVTGADDATIQAEGIHEALAIAIGGATGGTAITPVVAVTAVQNTVEASLGVDASIAAAGNADVDASLVADTEAHAGRQRRRD